MNLKRKVRCRIHVELAHAKVSVCSDLESRSSLEIMICLCDRAAGKASGLYLSFHLVFWGYIGGGVFITPPFFIHFTNKKPQSGAFSQNPERGIEKQKMFNNEQFK